MAEDTYLADLLVHLGCKADRADEVIAAAIKDGEDPDYLRKQIEAWTNYCLGPRGERIKAIGYFIAAKIEQNQPAPDLTPRPRDYAADWQRYVQRTVRDRWATIDYMTHTAEHIAGRREEVWKKLTELYATQERWIDKMNDLDAAANLLFDNGYEIECAPWCWADSPVAAEISRLETLLEVGDAAL